MKIELILSLVVKVELLFSQEIRREVRDKSVFFTCNVKDRRLIAFKDRTNAKKRSSVSIEKGKI